MTPVERRYRALVRLFPPAYRARREEELVATLLDAHPVRLGLRDTVDLLGAALVAWGRAVFGPAGRAAWRTAVPVYVVSLAVSLPLYAFRPAYLVWVTAILASAWVRSTRVSARPARVRVASGLLVAAAVLASMPANVAHWTPSLHVAPLDLALDPAYLAPIALVLVALALFLGVPGQRPPRLRELGVFLAVGAAAAVGAVPGVPTLVLVAVPPAVLAAARSTAWRLAAALHAAVLAVPVAAFLGTRLTDGYGPLAAVADPRVAVPLLVVAAAWARAAAALGDAPETAAS